MKKKKILLLTAAALIVAVLAFSQLYSPFMLQTAARPTRMDAGCVYAYNLGFCAAKLFPIHITDIVCDASDEFYVAGNGGFDDFDGTACGLGGVMTRLAFDERYEACSGILQPVQGNTTLDHNFVIVFVSSSYLTAETPVTITVSYRWCNIIPARKSLTCVFGDVVSVT